MARAALVDPRRSGGDQVVASGHLGRARPGEARGTGRRQLPRWRREPDGRVHPLAARRRTVRRLLLAADRPTRHILARRDLHRRRLRHRRPLATDDLTPHHADGPRRSARATPSELNGGDALGHGRRAGPTSLSPACTSPTDGRQILFSPCPPTGSASRSVPPTTSSALGGIERARSPATPSSRVMVRPPGGPSADVMQSRPSIGTGGLDDVGPRGGPGLARLAGRRRGGRGPGRDLDSTMGAVEASCRW